MFLKSEDDALRHRFLYSPSILYQQPTRNLQLMIVFIIKTAIWFIRVQINMKVVFKYELNDYVIKQNIVGYVIILTTC